MNRDVKFACPCYDVSGEAFRALIRQGVTDAATIQKMTGAGLGCGMCEDRMIMVIRETVQEEQAAAAPEKRATRRPRPARAAHIARAARADASEAGGRDAPHSGMAGQVAAVRGAEWFYSVAGRGDTVLFLHGSLDTSANYTRLVADLAGSFRVIAVDRRGHGRSTDTDAPYDYALMAEEIYEFTRVLGIGKFHIIGYSDGANLGLHLAGGHPEAVKSLVAISGNYKGLSGMSRQWLDMLPRLSEEFAREHMAKAVEQYMALNPRPDFAAHFAKTRAIWMEDAVISPEKLGAIRAATLLVCGDRDIVLPEQTIALRALIPGASLLILPDTGHTIFQDAAYKTPAAAAVPIIREFIAKRREG